MGKVIGIDLGTTNSCVAIMDGGKPRVIENSEGDRTTPSIVAFTKDDEVVVGQSAKRQAVTNPANTLYAVKRLIGRRFDEKIVQKDIGMVPYRIVKAENGDAWVEAQGRKMAPPEISARVLMKMKKTAEDFLGEEVTDAVVTVPAYFNDSQRQATKDAGRIAGLNVKRIINEPTAAALAYGLDKAGGDRKIAVYDLGGGTFDITILQLAGGVFSVKATGGDTHLGGVDFDQKIINLLADEFAMENGVDLRKDRMALQRLKEAAEKAKHELSSMLETAINVPFIAVSPAGPLHLERNMKRNELEMLCSELVDRTIDACRKTLADAKISVEQVNTIVLVGGMTRMPIIAAAVKSFFGKDASKEVNPDEVVAVGAALQGAALAGQIDEVLLLDVTPLSLGVETGGGVATRLIPRNTTVPTERSEVFTTSVDNQSFVPVHVIQGEREMAADCRSLARFELTGIPPAPRGIPKIQVTFRIDENGILRVEARDLGTGRAQEIRITAASGLSGDEVDRIVRDGEKFKETDALRRELAQLRNQAETLVYTTEQALTGYADLLEPQLLQEVQNDAHSLKMLLEGGGDLAALRDAYARLESAAFKIAEAMYGSAEGG